MDLNIPHNRPFIQIGANIGFDTFFDICKKCTPSTIIIIEPHESLHESLKRCYADIDSNVFYEAVAIVNDESITEITMYSSTGNSQHSSVIPLKDWNKTPYATVQATTIKNIIKKYNIDDIGLLYIDTEGNDSRIIDSLDLDDIKPAVIIWEAWDFTPEAYESEDVLNGIDGMNFIKNKLEKYNYTITRQRMNDDDNYIAILNT